MCPCIYPRQLSKQLWGQRFPYCSSAYSHLPEWSATQAEIKLSSTLYIQGFFETSYKSKASPGIFGVWTFKSDSSGIISFNCRVIPRESHQGLSFFASHHVPICLSQYFSSTFKGKQRGLSPLNTQWSPYLRKENHQFHLTQEMEHRHPSRNCSTSGV